MDIAELHISELIPYEFNSRNHSEEQINWIANSIKEFGFNQPIVIDKANTIIAGHGRYLAAKKLSLAKVPVVRKENLTELQIKAYRILDNKLQNDSTWAFNNLELDLGFLEDNGLNLADWGLDTLTAKLGHIRWDPEKTFDAQVGDGIGELCGYSLASFWKDIVPENAKLFPYMIDLPIQDPHNLIRAKYSKTNLEEIQRVITTYMRTGDYFLENCCGWSTFGSSAKLWGYSGVGVDIWNVALDHSRRQLEATPGKGQVEVREMNGLALDFPENTFDFVYCNPPFMDQEKYSGLPSDVADSDFSSFGVKFKQLMAENFRVLKPNNLCVITINDKREEGCLLPIQKHVIDWGMSVGFALHDFVVAEVLSQAIRIRRGAYNNRRTVKCHEYIITFIKSLNGD